MKTNSDLRGLSWSEKREIWLKELKECKPENYATLEEYMKDYEDLIFSLDRALAYETGEWFKNNPIQKN